VRSGVETWIPGGMFERHGMGASPWYDGDRFARDGIVCVIINDWSGRLDSNQRPHAPKAKKPTKHNVAQTNETEQKPKHDRDLPASSCLRFVTSYHWISHRHVNLRSTRTVQSRRFSH
jgi:hypothetical protein